MTDTPTAPADLAAAEQAAMMASFDEATAARADSISNDATVQPPAKAEPAKVAPAKAAEPAKVEDSEFPEELLSGKAAEPTADAPETEDQRSARVDKILSERPKGQIKHDHFEIVQNAAKEEVTWHRAELKKFKTDLEKLRANAGKLPEDHVREVEATKKQLTEAREELSRVAFERTPEFRERFTDREARLVGLAEKAAKDNGIDPKIIKNALASSGKQRFEILEGAGELSPGALSYISNVLAQHDDLQEEKATVLSQSKERYAQWQEAQKAQGAQRDAQQKAIEQQAFEEAGKALAAKHRLFQEAKGEKFKATQSAALAEAKRIFHEGNLSEVELATVAHKAAMFDVQERFLDHVVAERNSLKAKVAELTAAGPQVNGSAQQRPLNDEAGLTEEQRMERSWQEAHRARGLA